MPIAQALGYAPGRAQRAVVEPSAARTDLQIEVIETIAGLQALAPEWNALFERAGRPTQVFQTAAFAETWAQTYLDGSNTRLAILTGRRCGRLALVCPFVVEHSLSLDVLAWLGAPIAQYGDVLLDDAPEALALLDAAWDHICTELRPDVVRLRKVRADAAVSPLIERISEFRCCAEEAASVALGTRSGAGGETTSFEERQTAKARKNRRRLMRRLEEQGTVGFEALTSSQAAAARVAAGLAMKRRWLGERGLYSAAFSDHRIDQFFASAAEAGGPDTGCRVFALTLDGAPLAVAVGFESHGRLTLHMISYDLAHEKSGAGVLNLEAILRWAEARDLTAVDLLAPKAAYKMDWADSTAPVCDHAAMTSLRGRLFVRAVDGMLKPMAKTALARLPAGLTRHLVCRAG